MTWDFVQTSWSFYFSTHDLKILILVSGGFIYRKNRCCLMVFSWKKSWTLKDSHRVTEAMRWFPFLFMSLQQLFNVGGNLLGKCWGGKMGQLQPVHSQKVRWYSCNLGDLGWSNSYLDIWVSLHPTSERVQGPTLFEVGEQIGPFILGAMNTLMHHVLTGLVTSVDGDSIPLFNHLPNEFDMKNTARPVNKVCIAIKSPERISKYIQI